MIRGAEFPEQEPKKEPGSEPANPSGVDLHSMTPDQVLRILEEEDRFITRALRGARRSILDLAVLMETSLRREGRVIHIGAGTSGRLGALDAAEWTPTFGIEPDRIFSVMAGGDPALRRAVEGVEDDGANSRAELERIGLGPADLVVGISASGTTAFVTESLDLAREVGAARTLITTATDGTGADPDLLLVRLACGPEIITGSTRNKAAAATHLVLQRASNLCAIAMGWIHGGHMVEMHPTNAKLHRRAERIVEDLAGVNGERARDLLAAAEFDVKVALVCARRNCDVAAAKRALEEVDRQLDRLPEFQ